MIVRVELDRVLQLPDRIVASSVPALINPRGDVLGIGLQGTVMAGDHSFASDWRGPHATIVQNTEAISRSQIEP